MTRQVFDQELSRLQNEVLALGSMVQEALVESVNILKRRDLPGSRRLIAGDRTINERRYAIEQDAITLIATQQPMAGDMRQLAAILEIVTELERIGDYAKGIARINIMMGKEPFVKPLLDIPRMASAARDMLRRALQAYSTADVELARAIPEQDDYVDALYNQVYRELLTVMMNDPTTTDHSTYLLWVAHNLERAADRVINICERVVFTVTGKLEEMDSRDDEYAAGG